MDVINQSVYWDIITESIGNCYFAYLKGHEAIACFGNSEEDAVNKTKEAANIYLITRWEIGRVNGNKLLDSIEEKE